MTRYCFDLDGVLCTQVEQNYEEAQPDLEAIEVVNHLYEQGHTIIIHTARFMGRCGSNPIEVYKRGYAFTVGQLEEWGVLYHELHMGKPRYDLVIDDRSLFYDRAWMQSLREPALPKSL